MIININREVLLINFHVHVHSNRPQLENIEVVFGIDYENRTYCPAGKKGCLMVPLFSSWESSQQASQLFCFESNFITRLMHSDLSMKPPSTIPTFVLSAASGASTAATLFSVGGDGMGFEPMACNL
jgi:hypothetical protein